MALEVGKTPLVAIPTHWHGWRFRSRLEARWAVALDALGVTFQYEPQGYSMVRRGKKAQRIPYLCDFNIPKQERWNGPACWLEIKPEKPTDEEEEKAMLLAEGTGLIVYIFFSDCWVPSLMADAGYEGGYAYYPNGDWENFQWLYQCPHCQRNGIDLFGQTALSLCGCPKPSCHQNDHNPVLVTAFEKARGMRFDGTEK